VEKIANENSYMDYHKYDYRRAAMVADTEEEVNFPEYGNATYKAFSEIKSNEQFRFFDSAKSTMGDGETIISEYVFYEYVARTYETITKDLNYETDPEKFDSHQQFLMLCYNMMSGGQYKYDEEKQEENFVAFTAEEKEANIKTILDKLNADDMQVLAQMRLYDERLGSTTGETLNLKVVGFVTEKQNTGMSTAYLVDSVAQSLWESQKKSLEYYEEYETKYEEDATAIYSDVFLPYDGSAQRTDAFWELYANDQYNADDSIVTPTGAFIDTLKMVDDTVQSMSKVFLYVGLVLAVFAALLFSNFISVSISQKKKEIGILRAIGAKGSDVFKIFFSESTFIPFCAF